MFEGFTNARIEAGGASIHIRRGGDGPPLLLLHGYPETGAMWHKLAPELVKHFTVICPDLRGYGQSSKPPGGASHEGYSKRAMAADQIEVMARLGFERFKLVGHDRGARVAHRLCLDHPGRVERAAVLDIIPTAEVFARADKQLATYYYHWFFLIQPDGLPERLIGNDPDYFLERMLRSLSGADTFTADALAEYRHAFRDSAMIHATCEDYRAGASIDLEHDAADADAKVECPLLVLWGEKGVVGRLYDPLAIWRGKARDVRGGALPCGHFLPEEAPQETLAALLDFLRR